MRIAYLFSRYPVVSQTFCDTEILALERLGVHLEIFSIYPPHTSFRHGHAARIKAPIHYAPPSAILKMGEERAKAERRWPEALIADHDKRFGLEYKSALRARNALYFADLFKKKRFTHFHVHFANRAAHTAIFLKAISGIPFSISTHGQDFMSDLGSDDLLRELCNEAVFVANETDFSKELVASRCEGARRKMLRVFNGMDMSNFPKPAPAVPKGPAPIRVVSVGRLIEFKGFHHLIGACAALDAKGVPFQCDIIGEGPWRDDLRSRIVSNRLDTRVQLLGSLPQEEVFQHVKQADIFVLPCIVDRAGASDVFPTVILEAMASGKPVVSTKLAGVPEQVVDGETGLLVPPGDEVQLANALAALIQSEPLRLKMGEAARLRLETEFTVEKTVQPLLQEFKRHVTASEAPVVQESRLACLIGSWPGDSDMHAQIRQLRGICPAMRAYVAKVTGATPPPHSREILSSMDFLPDGMVLEGEWQMERDLARRVETWRADFSQKLSSEWFIEQARRAIYLRAWVRLHCIRHVHAWTSWDALCAWMLSRLAGVTFSLSIERGDHAFSDSDFEPILSECAGVRIESTEADAQKYESIAREKGARVVRSKPGKAFDHGWLENLSRWASR